MIFHAFTNANSAEQAALDVLTDADNSARNVILDRVFRVETTQRADEVADGYLAVHPVAIVLSYAPGRFGPMSVYHVVGSIDSI